MNSGGYRLSKYPLSLTLKWITVKYVSMINNSKSIIELAIKSNTMNSSTVTVLSCLCPQNDSTASQFYIPNLIHQWLETFYRHSMLHMQLEHELQSLLNPDHYPSNMVTLRSYIFVGCCTCFTWLHLILPFYFVTENWIRDIQWGGINHKSTKLTQWKTEEKVPLLLRRFPLQFPNLGKARTF